MKNKIIAVIGIIALSLIIINMSVSHSKLSKTVDSKNVILMKTKLLCSVKEGTEYTFDYTGGEQTFKAPCNGKYRLETWGAQGGAGAVGGFSQGIILLKKNNTLYINVGGTGKLGNEYLKPAAIGAGGYNGGGNSGLPAPCSGSYCAGGGGGGGATHIATKSGILSSLENYKDSIILVSGGGGGITIHASAIGYGGGFKGGSTKDAKNTIIISGGTQTTGYKFGQGQNGINQIYNKVGAEGLAGGGGGFYGGFAQQNNNYENDDASGAGGSGYIGNSLLTDKHMACYYCETSSEESTKTISVTCASETPTSDCAKIGNGYAKITYLGN